MRWHGGRARARRVSEDQLRWLERLVEAPAYEMRYSDLDRAVEELDSLVARL